MLKNEFDEILDEDEIDDTVPYLHIHGQKTAHDNIFIVGNHDSLIQLHRALTNAIMKGEGKTKVVFCNNGEGYYICIRDIGNDSMSGMCLPYDSND